MRKNILEKFYSQIKENRWVGSKDWNGYGIFYLGRYTNIGAHVFSFILHNKRMPLGDVHHTCEDTSCVDPLHLEELSRSEHTSLHRTKEFCSVGHRLAEVGQTKSRNCKKCLSMQSKKFKRITVGGKRILIRKEKEMNNESATAIVEQKGAGKLDNRLHECSK